MAIGTAAAIGLGLGAIGAVASSSANKSAANTAANAQTQNTAANNALAQSIYNQNQATLAPYVGAGIPATNTLTGLYGLGTAAQSQQAAKAFGQYIQNSDYGFQFGTGSNALNSGLATGGTLQSGAAMKDLERFRQNLQAGYRNEFAGGVANQQALGLGAASAQAGVGQNYTNTVTANNTNAANALSNAALVRGQNNPLAAIASTAGGFLSGWG